MLRETELYSNTGEIVAYEFEPRPYILKSEDLADVLDDPNNVRVQILSFDWSEGRNTPDCDYAFRVDSDIDLEHAVSYDEFKELEEVYNTMFAKYRYGVKALNEAEAEITKLKAELEEARQPFWKFW